MGRPYLLVGALLIGALVAWGSPAHSATPLRAPAAQSTPAPTPPTRIATAAELAHARVQWQHSAHAETFDKGMGANTTCARCKSPLNWDPVGSAATQAQALNCGACKRTPGAPRPELTGGTAVAESDWKQIGCAICHKPAGDSFETTIAFWDQAREQYLPMATTSELCAECHEGQHGFQVMDEQAASPAHRGWSCVRCHGSHGDQAVKCTDCHDPSKGKGVADHARHRQVNCSACHDAGGLSIWHETDPDSKHYGEVITLRFAHALTSWTSHDITLAVRCERCHHPANESVAPVADSTSCTVCHPDGAALTWCRKFERNPDPNVTAAPKGGGQ
ncbi:MAG: hypothetical protein HZB53_22155 [Chloroflexi bacterium]|nr:hypothetical protein [Chloroflexota bacterium]